ncbi:MAG: sucrase ferredoxin, partial [Pyrinomonadaceae bacterium]
RRDKCCAKFGYALYKSLRERHGAAVWQSSHVGGDRFAANLLCFPHGLFYAHVGTDAGARIVEEYGRGHVVLENYRGRACYAPQLQAAEYFVRAESGTAGLVELHHAGGARISETVWRFRFNAPAEGKIYEAQVSCHQSEFANFITCAATEAKSVRQFALEEFTTRADPAHARADE